MYSFKFSFKIENTIDSAVARTPVKFIHVSFMSNHDLYVLPSKSIEDDKKICIILNISVK